MKLGGIQIINPSSSSQVSMENENQIYHNDKFMGNGFFALRAPYVDKDSKLFRDTLVKSKKAYSPMVITKTIKKQFTKWKHMCKKAEEVELSNNVVFDGIPYATFRNKGELESKKIYVNGYYLAYLSRAIIPTFKRNITFRSNGELKELFLMNGDDLVAVVMPTKYNGESYN